MDDVLKEDLGPMYVGVPCFYEAFFGQVAGLEPAAKAILEKCKEGDKPLYCEENGWRGWPNEAKERDVLNWFAQLSSGFVDLAEEHRSIPKVPRRPLAQPNQPLQGSTA